MKYSSNYLTSFLLCLLAGATLFGLKSCIQPFAPPEITNARQFLVVDGSLNTSPGDSSQIRLSRTQNVYDKGLPAAELRARVTVEGDRGSRYTFVEAAGGLYKLGPVSIQTNEKYRLHIRTSGGQEYLSDYVPALTTPPIDSLTYRVNSGGDAVQIFVNTHDDANKTRFYRWSFDETWQYYMPLYSVLEVVGNEIVPRTQSINTCWSYDKASQIILASSVKLSKDIIQNQPLANVPASSGKFRVKYSILVKQYGLTQEAFEYWTNLAKTTERTGSLFDPQPAQVTGNITCTTDPAELVFGYFSAVAPQEKRLFITELLGRFVSSCEPTDTLSLAEALEAYDLILTEFPIPGSPIPLYITGSADCTDCRTKGGTIQRPDFWQ